MSAARLVTVGAVVMLALVVALAVVGVALNAHAVAGQPVSCPQGGCSTRPGAVPTPPPSPHKLS